MTIISPSETFYGHKTTDYTIRSQLRFSFLSFCLLSIQILTFDYYNNYLLLFMEIRCLEARLAS